LARQQLDAILKFYAKKSKQTSRQTKTAKQINHKSFKLKHFGLFFPQVFAVNNIGKGPAGTKTFTLRTGSGLLKIK